MKRMLIVALALLFCGPALATPQAKCIPVREAISKLASNQDIKFLKLLSGAEAVALGKKLGAPYTLSDVLIYAEGDFIHLAAFRDKCFVEVVSIPREVFTKAAPGVL